MVAITALWVPGRILCTACLDMLALAGEEDRRCDRCSVVAPAGQIRPAMTSLAPSGALMVLLGLCATCLPHEVAA
jgi:hypothetical protein